MGSEALPGPSAGNTNMSAVESNIPVFEFRPLAESDIPLLYEWLRRPHLIEWWRNEQTAEEVREKYLPRIQSPGGARPFIAVLRGEPLGYIQYYPAAEGDPNWWPDKPGPGVLGIDQFLADADRLGRGLGTAMVGQFVDRLFQDRSVTEIRVDPHPDNVRAIRCYTKVGFREIGRFTSPDGPAVLMVLKRDEPRAIIEASREGLQNP